MKGNDSVEISGLMGALLIGAGSFVGAAIFLKVMLPHDPAWLTLFNAGWVTVIILCLTGVD